MKNVLLLGNGIDRSFNSDPISWGDLLDKMTTNHSIPKHDALPFPLKVVLRTDDHVDEALKGHCEELMGSAADEKLREVLTCLLTLGFDDILTTNYDYTCVLSIRNPQVFFTLHNCGRSTRNFLLRSVAKNSMRKSGRTT